MDTHDKPADYYRVKNWDEHFENNRTREMKKMGWVPVPNKHDGESYKRIMQENDGIVIYGCWHLILQVASKTQARGTLLRDDRTPITADAMAIRTGWSIVKDFERALQFLSSPEIAWLEVVTQDGDAIPHLPAAIPHLPARKGIERKERKEGKELPETASIPEIVTYIKACRPEFGNLPDAGLENVLKDVPKKIAHKAVVEFCENQVNAIAPAKIPANLLGGYIKKIMPQQSNRPATKIRECRDVALSHAVDKLQAAASTGGDDGVSRCMKSLCDIYRDYGKNREGLTVAGEAYEVFKYRKNGKGEG